jgi:predicted metal-dependent RNase
MDMRWGRSIRIAGCRMQSILILRRCKESPRNFWCAAVQREHGFSGHADREGPRAFFRPLGERQSRVCLVHGDLEQSNALAGTLGGEGFADVTIPKRGESVAIGRDGAE